MANKAHIEVYARVRPVKRPSPHFEIDYADHALAIKLPRDHSQGVNNQRENYAFAFSRVLDQGMTQDQVFETVAQPVVDSVLEGYNGTIFAYGQTGSGKTFTITGGAERYADRGIIPRTISYIFQQLQSRTDCHFEVRISYLEIYNEAGYDLLDPSHETKGLEDLPKVSLQEDDDGKIHLKNLSAQLARSEEEALNHLFVGDTNRMISETPMNVSAARTHPPPSGDPPRASPRRRARAADFAHVRSLAPGGRWRRRARTASSQSPSTCGSPTRTWCAARRCAWSTSPGRSGSRRRASRGRSCARPSTSTSRSTSSSR